MGGGNEHFGPWEGGGVSVRVRVRVWPVWGRGVRDELHGEERMEKGYEEGEDFAD